ncbi:hypothetical protein C4J87_0169 [Pseudomonas sp. R1-43-08]|nr:hypothetical protein C4J88_0168 [Pseudomonas sp. R4-39-08]AZF40361.1 hypothetical protein C4J87_0169 [Pseudomonas sp. R1-43-08]
MAVTLLNSLLFLLRLLASSVPILISEPLPGVPPILFLKPELCAKTWSDPYSPKLINKKWAVIFITAFLKKHQANENKKANF